MEFEKLLRLISEIKQMIKNCETSEIRDIPDYQKKIEKNLKRIKHNIDILLNDLKLDNHKEIFKKKFENYNNELIKTRWNQTNLTNFYQNKFADMKLKVITETNKECIGYSEINIKQILETAESINEIVYVLHSYILNNEQIYQKQQLIGKKIYNNGYEISLYGKSNDYAKQIYNLLPLDSQNGKTDIVGLDDIILMMIKDRGHALSLDIQIKDDKSIVRYFIPKLYNIETINLNNYGISNIDNNTQNIKGEYEIETKNLAPSVINFIECVPIKQDVKTYKK